MLTYEINKARCRSRVYHSRNTSNLSDIVQLTVQRRCSVIWWKISSLRKRSYKNFTYLFYLKARNKKIWARHTFRGHKNFTYLLHLKARNKKLRARQTFRVVFKLFLVLLRIFIWSWFSIKVWHSWQSLVQDERTQFKRKT